MISEAASVYSDISESDRFKPGINFEKNGD